MKTSPIQRSSRGFVSFLLVLSTGAILTMLMIFAYRAALHSQEVQSQVQLRVDYSEKEEAILRSIVAITPNRAIRAMQANSAAAGTSAPLSWGGIFTDSLNQANVRNSMSDELKKSLEIENLKSGNTGDSSVAGIPNVIFRPAFTSAAAGDYVSAGINRVVAEGYPPALTSSDATTSSQDVLYPIISDLKMGDGLAAGTAPNFNVLPYPNINFGYATPGQNFVAKRNWWAFSVDAGAQDDALTHLARKRRNFVLSIYEVPSQLSISASSFMSLGQFASGDAWQNVAIEGGIFAGRAELLGPTALNALATRRGGTTMDARSTIGGQNFTGADPFAAGVRETFQVTQGAFFPVSMASESGRAAFIPISRGELFFDRFAHPATEPNALSTTTWNNYTIGALQCAMRLDISEVDPQTKEPTILKFQYFLANGNPAVPMDIVLTRVPMASLPDGYVGVADGVEPLPGEAVDLAYLVDGLYYFEQGVTGPINFDGTFGLGTGGAGFWRRRCPFEIKKSPQTSQFCVVVNGERIPDFLDVIGAAPVGPGGTVAVRYNNSLVVNVDYSSIGPEFPTKPNIPCEDTDYGVVLDKCEDLTAFTSGFSLVTNLRLFMAEHFCQKRFASGRVVPTSLFCPERRIGFSNIVPLDYVQEGQLGSLTKGDKVNEGEETATFRPLDIKKSDGTVFTANTLTTSLTQIRTTAELPPITMMNWLVLLEEVR